MTNHGSADKCHMTKLWKQLRCDWWFIVIKIMLMDHTEWRPFRNDERIFWLLHCETSVFICLGFSTIFFSPSEFHPSFHIPAQLLYTKKNHFPKAHPSQIFVKLCENSSTDIKAWHIWATCYIWPKVYTIMQFHHMMAHLAAAFNKETPNSLNVTTKKPKKKSGDFLYWHALILVV